VHVYQVAVHKSDQHYASTFIYLIMYSFNLFIYLFDIHVSVHRKYISKVQPTRCKVFSIYLLLQIPLHVSGSSSTHHQEHKTVHTASDIVKPILLPAAIVDEMEPHLIHDSSRHQYWFDNTWRCMYEYRFVLLMMGRGTA
jgi:hypothetical protein